MGKKFISIILIILTIFLFTACDTVKNDNATIQVWCYNYSNCGWYTEAIVNVIKELETYCEKNSIPIEIVQYSEDTLAYEDYILKRNSAMANGNMITIDDARSLHDIGKYHADYSKVENYNKLFDAYKDRFCIPIGMGYRSIMINNEILEYYGIRTDRSIITTSDYLDIKQQIREKGGSFRLNFGEYREFIESYLLKNGLMYFDENNKIMDNTNEFKEAIKKSVIEIYNNFKIYYEKYEDIDAVMDGKLWFTFEIYDENSGLKLTDYENIFMITDYNEYMSLNDDILNKTFVIGDKCTFRSPCVYMHKKITNNKIYDVFNKLIDESTYAVATQEKYHGYAPVQDTEKIRQILEVDNNWQYNGKFLESANMGNEIYKKNIDIINETYELIVKEDETASLIASYYFNNWDYSENVFNCVSGILMGLLSNKLDYKTPEGEDFINKDIDEFITNLNVHYN